MSRIVRKSWKRVIAALMLLLLLGQAVIPAPGTISLAYASEKNSNKSVGETVLPKSEGETPAIEPLEPGEPLEPAKLQRLPIEFVFAEEPIVGEASAWPEELIVCREPKTMGLVRTAGLTEEQQPVFDLVAVPPESSMEAVVAELRADPTVLFVEPNYLVRAAAADSPNDPRFNEQWALSLIGAPAAWVEHEAELGGATPITIAVLDSGLDAAHEDLPGERFLAGKNFATKKSDGTLYTDPNNYADDSGHGTNVTGIMTAEHDNAKGIVGVLGPTPVNILPLKVLNDKGAGTVFDLAKGIKFAADEGAKILNLSLTTNGNSQTLAAAILYAQEKGALVIAAMGDSSQEPYPASYPGVIAVGAVESGKWGYSTAYGEHLDLMAPGYKILTTGLNSTYNEISGTSAAAAHVSAAAALYLALNPAATPRDIYDALVATAENLGSEGWDRYTGYGLLQVSALLNHASSLTPQPKFTAPLPGARVMGEVTLQVEAVNSSQVSGVAFYLGELNEGKLLARIEKSNQSFLAYEWNTTAVADGQHTIYARCYQESNGEITPVGEAVALTLRVDNAASTGLTFQIIAPNGTVPSQAALALYRHMSPEEYDYDSNTPYAEIGEYDADALGLVRIPGMIALDLHDYVAIVRGTFDCDDSWQDFVSVKELESPGSLVLDTSTTRPVAFSLLDLDNERLPYSRYILRILDGTGLHINTLNFAPQAELEKTIYLDERLYDAYAFYSKTQADYASKSEVFPDGPAYFLGERRVQIGADTTSVEFRSAGTTALLSGRLVDGKGIENFSEFWLGLSSTEFKDVFSGNNWTLGFYEKEIIASPGDYILWGTVITSGGDEYYFKRNSFVISGPGAIVCGFGGQLELRGEITSDKIPTNDSLGYSYLPANFSLVDAYGNSLNRMRKGPHYVNDVALQMVTYKVNGEERQAATNVNTNWDYYSVGGRVARSAGDYLLELSIDAPLFGGTIISTHLPFSIVDPAVGETVDIPVYDLTNALANNLSGSVRLYTLKDYGFGLSWGWQTYSVNSAGYIQIPKDVQLSDQGNAVCFIGEVNGEAVLYNKTFTDLANVTEIRLSDCIVPITLSTLDAVGNASAIVPQLQTHLKGNTDLDLQPTGWESGYKQMKVTPGYYSFQARQEGGKVGEGAFIYFSPRAYIDAPKSVTLGQERATLTASTTSGFFMENGEDEFIEMYNQKADTVIWWRPQKTPSIALTPGSYQAQGWVAQLEPEPERTDRYKWVYGADLAGRDASLNLAEGNKQVILGGPFTVDFALEGTDLTTDDCLQGEVFISDTQGNRIFAVGIRRYYGRGGESFAFSEHVEQDAEGRLLVPRPEVLAQGGDWPFVYPFLRLYQIDPLTGEETRILNEFAEEYFYSFSLPLADLSPSEYRVELAIGMGPGGVLTKSRKFSLTNSSISLDALVPITNKASLELSGVATPGATIDLYYWFEGDAGSTLSGTTTADGVGRFSLQFAFPAGAKDGLYSFTARATGEESQPVSIRLDRLAPQAAKNLQGTAEDAHNIRLAWEGSVSDDVKSYRLSRGQMQVAEIPATAPLSYLDSDLAPATTYTYSLVAVDEAGNVSLPITTQVTTGTVVDDKAPATPPAPTVVYEGAGVAKITWEPTTDNIGVANYQLLRFTGDTEPVGEPTVLCTILAAEILAHTDTGLWAGSTYGYALRAYDVAKNESELSPIAYITTSPLSVNLTELRLPVTMGRLDQRLVYLDAGLNLRLLGEKNRQARAEITYTTYLDENGNELAEAIEKIAPVTLVEDTAMPGSYKGTYTLPRGLDRILAINGILADGNSSASRAFANTPLQSTGELEVGIPVGQLADLKGLTLSVWSATNNSGQSFIIAEDTPEYTIQNLAPATDYTLKVTSKLGRDIVRMERVLVKGGLTQSLTTTPLGPAQIVVKVLGPNGPVPNAHVFAHDRRGFLPSIAATCDSQGVAELSMNALDGDKFEIRAEPPLDQTGTWYEAGRTAYYDVKAGENIVEITLLALPTATIKGRATLEDTGEPLGGVAVRLIATVVDRSFVVNTTSDADGSYLLALPAGLVTMSASLAGNYECKGLSQTSGSFLVEAGEVLEKDLQFVRSSKAKLDVTITAKYLDQPPVIYDGMDWWTASHFCLSAIRSDRKGSSTYPFNLLVQPNEKITVSADGGEAGLPKATQEVQLDENRYAKVNITLVEQGRIVGRLVDGQGNKFPLGNQPELWKVTASRIEGNKSLSMTTTTPDSNSAFSLSLPGPGKYVVRVHMQNYWFGGIANATPKAEIGPIVVGPYEIVDVGKMKMAFGEANAQGYVTVSQREMSPGSTILAQAVFSRRSFSPLAMDAVQLTLGLPSGCELVPGSVAFAGQVLAPISSNPLAFSLGNLHPQGGEELRLSFMTLLDTALPQVSKMLLSGRLEWTEGALTKSIDLAPSEIRPIILTIEGPSVATRRELTVNGKAPANSAVAVYEGTELLGTAQVSPNGQWRLPITLPDAGSKAKHFLHAVTSSGEVIMQSDLLTVKYDPNEPALTQVAFQQGLEGRIITFDPANGVARFPYVIRPGAGDLRVTLTFDNPDRVGNVKVSIPPFAASAVRNGDDFTASIRFSGWNLGGLYLEYETKPSPGDLKDIEPITEEQLRRQLPFGVRDYEATVQEEILPPPIMENPMEGWPADAKTRAIDVTLPQMPGVVARIETSIATNVSYSPTLEEEKRAETTGIPVYGFRSSELTVTDDEISFWVEGYIPVEYLEQTPHGRMAISPATVKAAAAGKLMVRQLTKVKLSPLEQGIKMREKHKDAKDLWNAPDQFDRLNDIVDAASECGASGSKYRKMADEAARDLMVANGSKWAFKLGSVLVAPVSFGVGSVALFAAGEALDLALDYGMNQRLDDIEQQMADDSECKRDDEDEDDDDYDDDFDDDYDDDADGSRGGRKKKAADPSWIWDPSGIVYAGVMTNPLEGVKATLYEVQPETGALIFWDADWYGQENPVYTDGVGYYGWDVPVGKWQVVYEKEGYMPAKSEVLPVPPPQLEVHKNLINLTPPQAIWAKAAAGGSYLQVIFDQYMLANTLSPSTLALTVEGDEGLEYVAGSVEAIDAVPGTADDTLLLTRKVRFVPTDPLTANEKYTLTISGAAQSYGAIPMGSPFTKVITVPEMATPVTGVGALQVTPDYTWAGVTWQDPALDYLQVKLVWKLNGVVVGQAVVEKGVAKYQMRDLFAGTTYELDVMTVDGLGNESAKQMLPVKTKEVKRYDPKLPVNPPVDPPIKPPTVVDPPAVQPIGEVSGLQVNASDGSLQVSWKEPASADLKEVKLTWKAKGTEALLGQQLITKGIGTYTITGLTNGTEYEIIVRTISKQGKESTGVKAVGTPFASDSVTVTTTGEQQTISAFDQELQLSLAAGSFAAGTSLTLRRVPAQGQTPGDKTLAFVGHLYSCDAETEPLQGPIYLALRYDKELLGKEDARKLGIYRQDEQDPTNWIYVGGVVDLVTGRLTVRTDRLGTYAVMLRRSTFSDITRHWAKGDVEIITARSLAVGIGNGLFDPNRPITRAELATFMVRLVLNSDRFDSSQTAAKPVPQFSDVKPGDWYSGVVKTAAKLGIVPATGGAFRPEAPATRLEMAGMLAKVMALLGRPLEGEGVFELPFTDVKSLSSNDRAIIGQNWFNGLMGGMGDGKFSPQGTSTRAQVATVMLRVLERTGQAITTSIEEGTLKASTGAETQYVLSDCRGDSPSYRLTPMSERAAQELASLNGQTVRAVVLRVQEAKPGTAIPQLRALSVTAVAGG